MDSVDLSVVGGENQLSVGFVDGAPKLNPDPDPSVVLSPTLGAELPKPKPTGFPILPPGFPKVNEPVLGGEALPKKPAGLSEEAPNMLVDVEEDAVALPKRVVLALEVSLASEGGGVNSDGLLDSVIPLPPKIEPPNTDIGLDTASEVPGALVGLGAKKLGALLEPKLGAVEAGRDNEIVEEPSFSWPAARGTDLDMVFSALDGVVNEKPGAEGVEAVKADFGGSGVVDENVSVGLDVRPKGKCVGAELEGGTKGGNVKPPVFIPPSLVEGSLGDASADPPDGFGIENNEVAFSGGGLAPKREAELVVAELRAANGCEDPSNSD